MLNEKFRPTVVIADDYEDDIDHILNYLPARYQALTASTAEEARALLDSHHVVLAIVDLYLDVNNRVPRGLDLLQNYRHVPFLIMSGQDGGMIDSALSHYRDRHLRIVSKDRELKDAPQIEKAIDDQLGRHYDFNLDLNFRTGGDWRAIAIDLDRDSAELDLAARAYELEMLVRNAFCEWDRSKSDFIRATQIWVEEIIHKGDNSVVLRLAPYSQFSAPQAEVVLKITRSSEDHSKFDEYKNILGGYGLRERRYARTCNYHAQVYSVPYFRYEQTATYRDFFVQSGADDASLSRIADVTTHLFYEALGHFADRPPTGRQTRSLRDYYLARIKGQKRVAAIGQDLLPGNAPASIGFSADGSTLAVSIGARPAQLPMPVLPVLSSGQYSAAGMLMDTAVRHGDMHGSNVLVDGARRTSWYIDYEHFGVDHYCLADHVEMEAHILFSAARISRNIAFWAQLTQALIESPVLELPADIALNATDAADKAEAAKALQAIRIIRQAAQLCNTANSALPYYHALLFEALRAAGARSKEPQRRWHALVTAAQLFERIERM